VFNINKKINIPKNFTLFGHKYTIVIKKDLFETEDCYGTADEDLKIIQLQDIGTVKRRYEEDGKVYESDIIITEEMLIETFFHEVMHIILDATGEEQLSENEKFVNIVGKSWLEIYLSSNYDEKDSEKKEV
jgi:hypothetical protein